VNVQWACASCSSDGKVIYAGSSGASLYVSTNGGTSWTDVSPVAAQVWTGVACSADGSHVVVTSSYGKVWASSDYGDTWTEVKTASYYHAPACDSTGEIVVIGLDYTPLYSKVYRSTNQGGAWSDITPAGMAGYTVIRGIAMSSDGATIYASNYGGRIWKSTNGGTSWAEVRPAGDADENWASICCSSDGSIVYAVVTGGRAYVSTNGGTSWTETGPAVGTNHAWITVRCDAAADVVMITSDDTGSDGKVFISTDSGANWVEHTPAGVFLLGWQAAAASSDGSTLIAGVDGGRLFSADHEVPIPIPVTRGTDNPKGEDIWFDLAGEVGPNTTVTPSGDWKLVSGREALRQSLIRRFITNPGEWRTKPGYGAGLSGMVRKKLTKSMHDQAVTAIRSQALVDKRVQSVDTVDISRLADASGGSKPGWRVHVVVIPKLDPTPLDVDFPVPGE
jgi:photosystem II stability/assembly factor-like uncharacterized protein/phage baseplate assembly protein W